MLHEELFIAADDCSSALSQVSRGSYVGDEVVLRVYLDYNSVLRHLLLNQDYFFDAFNDKISSWVVWALADVCELLLRLVI